LKDTLKQKSKFENVIFVHFIIVTIK